MEQPFSTEGQSLSQSIVKVLSAIPIFERLDMAELALVARHMNYKHLAKGEILFNEFDPGTFVCFVVEGELNVMKRAGHDQSVVLRTLGKGRSIGEMAVIENQVRSATVVANSDSVLLLLSQSAFDRIIETQPRIGVKLLKGLACLLSDSLRKTSTRLADYMLPLA
ncbi:MAG: cyclic nucleotide-binding domain-containing protein [Desulfatibacillaceae bacterium]|nr:cyclic nucleotide-binding domain-containing protein [Desulfatibacillaceae bacterium]